MIDWFVRAIASGAASFGRGLAEAERQEREREVRENLLRLQSLESLRGNLFSSFLSDLTSKGFSILSEEEKEEYRKLMAQIADPQKPLDNILLQRAVELSSKVKKGSAATETIEGLLKNGRLDEAGLIIYNMDPESGQRLLEAAGYSTWYGTLHRLGRQTQIIRDLRQRLDETKIQEVEKTLQLMDQQSELLEKQIENLDLDNEQKRQFLSRFREKLDAETRKALAEAAESEQRLKELLETWPERLKQLILDSDIKQAQKDQLLASIEQIKANTKLTVAQTARVEAETQGQEITNALNQLKLDLSKQFALSEAQVGLLERLTNVLREYPEATKEQIGVLANSILGPAGFRQEVIQSFVEGAHKTLQTVAQNRLLRNEAEALEVARRRLGLSAEEANNLKTAFDIVGGAAKTGAPYEQIRPFIITFLTKTTGDPAKAEALAESLKKAYERIATIANAEVREALIKSISPLVPLGSEQENFLKRVYDDVAKTDPRLANEVIAAVKDIVRMRYLEFEQKVRKGEADIAQESAMAEYYKALTTLTSFNAEKARQEIALMPEWDRMREAALDLQARSITLGKRELALEREKFEFLQEKLSQAKSPSGEDFLDAMGKYAKIISSLEEQIIGIAKNKMPERCTSESSSLTALLMREGCNQEFKRLLERDPQIKKLYETYTQAATDFANKLGLLFGKPTDSGQPGGTEKPGGATPPPPSNMQAPTGIGVPSRVPPVVSGVVIAQTNFAPQPVQRALNAGFRYIDIGLAAAVAPGEGGPGSNPLQIKPGSGLTQAEARQCGKYGDDYILRAACQAKLLVEHPNSGRGSVIYDWNVAQVGVIHMYPKLSGNPDGKMTGNDALNQIAVRKFVATTRGADWEKITEFKGADIGAYYAYNALNAYRDLIEQASGVKFSDDDVGRRSMLLMAYGLAYLNPTDRPDFNRAIRRAMEHLGIRGADEQEVRKAAMALSQIHYATTPRTLGRLLSEQKPTARR